MAIINEITLFTTAYFITFIVTTTLVVYVLHLPTFITGQTKLVQEYYYENFFKSFVLDLFLVLIYLLISQLGIYWLNANHILTRIIIVAFTTLCISGGFYLFFTGRPLDKGSFFSKWFYAAGFRAVLYDIVLLMITYTILMIMLVKTKDRIKMVGIIA